MSKKIKKIIKKTRHQLRWRVEIITGCDHNTCLITSNPRKKTHKIEIPAQDVREIEYLHELGHALLCETRHQMLSTHYFEPGTSEEILKQITPAVRCMADWFVDAWLIKIAPAEEKAEIMEHFKMVNNLPDSALEDPKLLTGAALIIAQAIKFCGVKKKLSGQLKMAVSALLCINPEETNTKNIEKLTNNLLNCYSDIKIEAVFEKNLWILKEIEK